VQKILRLSSGCIEDLTGNFTCHNLHGSSVVDYACVSECLLPKVKFFSVHNFLPDLSDHCQISLMMKINCTAALSALQRTRLISSTKQSTFS
jgi:hypothetical protein